MIKNNKIGLFITYFFIVSALALASLNIISVKIANAQDSTQNLQFSGDLKVGSTGSDVNRLQVFLIKSGYHISPIENGQANYGYFGQATRQALSKYQQTIGVNSSGYFGPITRGRINSSANLVLSGTPVKVIVNNPPGRVPIGPGQTDMPVPTTVPTQATLSPYYSNVDTGGLCSRSTQPITGSNGTYLLTSSGQNPQYTGNKSFNIDFGQQLPDHSSLKTGAAVVGNSGDYWNTVSVAWCDDHVRRNLKYADGSASPITAELINLGGSWASSYSNGKLGLNDPMLDDFAYPQNNKGGNATVILNNISAGTYDLYLYSKTITASQNGDYTVNVGSRGYGQKLTSTDPASPQATTWQEGNQYVKFPGITVNNGDAINILIQPGIGLMRDAQISGLQLVPANTIITPPVTPTIGTIRIVDLTTGQNTFGLHLGGQYKIIWTGTNITNPVNIVLRKLSGTTWNDVMNIGTSPAGTAGSIIWPVPASFQSGTDRYAIFVESSTASEKIEVQFVSPIPTVTVTATPSPSATHLPSTTIQPEPVLNHIPETNPMVQPDTRTFPMTEL